MAIGNAAEQAGAREAELLVQRQRGRIVGIDIADHLAEAGRRTSIDQFPQQQPPDPAAARGRVDVDRVLDHPGVHAPVGDAGRRRPPDDPAVLEVRLRYRVKATQREDEVAVAVPALDTGGRS